MIRGADDLLQDLGIPVAVADGPRPRVPPDLSEEERRAWDALEGTALPDSVAREIGRSIPDAVALLIGLELRGLVRSVGGRYERAFVASRPP
jgi:predicted Rossmann fold nucleotide-binding protein DprA/Smf involved in DNA uptake